MKKSLLSLFVVFILVLTVGLVSSLNYAADLAYEESSGNLNYFGYLNYAENYSYYFYINDSARTITFLGLNESNSDHNIVVGLDPTNHFVKRINYVWYHGWYDAQYLYLDQYVPAGIIYSDNASLISGDTYFADFIIENIPYLELSNLTLDVTVNTTSNESTLYSISHPSLNSTTYMVPTVNGTMAAAHPFVAGLLETRINMNTEEGSSAIMEIHLWVKEDLIVHGTDPQWVVPLYPTNQLSIELISPLNAQVFQTSGNQSQIDFQFMVSNYTVSPSCLVNLVDSLGNSTFSLNSSLNETTGVGVLNWVLGVGNYNWSVSCRSSPSFVLTSQSNSFSIEHQNPPIILVNQEEEGGRRRSRNNDLGVNNLSNSLEPKNGEDARGNSLISLITGAVTGAVGKTGTLGVGIFLVLLGVLGSLIYQRDRLRIVKKSQ